MNAAYYQQQITKTIVAGVVAIPLLVIAMTGKGFSLHSTEGFVLNGLIAFLSLIILMYSGRQFFIGAWKAWLFNKMTGHNQTTTPAATTHQDQTASNAPASQVQDRQHGFGFFRLLLLLVAFYLIWKFIRRRRDQGPRPSSFSAQNPGHRKTLGDYISGTGVAANQTSPINMLNQQDYDAFQSLLLKIQAAWSSYDMQTLQNLTTPEMYQSFTEIIQENQKQGIKNFISQVQLTNQALQDAWQEGENQYARVLLNWEAIDYAVNSTLPSDDPNYLVDGSMTMPRTATEIWTFERTSIHPWRLADIQQT